MKKETLSWDAEYVCSVFLLFYPKRGEFYVSVPEGDEGLARLALLGLPKLLEWRVMGGRGIKRQAEKGEMLSSSRVVDVAAAASVLHATQRFFSSISMNRI